jgi:predicted dehydrogenase
MTVRWGVIGPGRIAGKLVRDFRHAPGAELVAVASRDAARAEAFATEHGIPHAYGSYPELLATDLDVVYIATPHPTHRAIALAAIAAGTGVLVEKSFTLSPAATREVVEAATSAGVFAMEAMWTRFQPAIVRLRALVDGGVIGEVRTVQADLGVSPPVDPGDRFYSPELGGGALFDVGVYPISFAQMVLGTPDTVTAYGSLAETGVDAEETVLLGYPDGRAAALVASIRCASPGSARVVGTAGWIEVPPRFHHPDRIVLNRPGAEPEVIVAAPIGGGYAHQLIEVTERIAAGHTQSEIMPPADTIAVQDVMAQVAEQLGMRPAEGPATL